MVKMQITPFSGAKLRKSLQMCKFFFTFAAKIIKNLEF
jgi:hypothetical protein